MFCQIKKTNAVLISSSWLSKTQKFAQIGMGFCTQMFLGDGRRCLHYHTVFPTTQAAAH